MIGGSGLRAEQVGLRFRYKQVRLVFLVEPVAKGVCKVFDTGFARERIIVAGEIGFVRCGRTPVGRGRGGRGS